MPSTVQEVSLTLSHCMKRDTNPKIDMHGLKQMDACNRYVILCVYATLHMTHATSRKTLAIEPRTGRGLTAGVSQGQDKKRPTKWVRPPSQRGKDER